MKFSSFTGLTLILSAGFTGLSFPDACLAVTPTILANNAGSPENMIVDNSTVYWADDFTGQISSVSKNPGGVVRHYSPNMDPGGDLVQDNASLYFCGAPAAPGGFVGEHLLYKVSKAGGLSNTLSDHHVYGGPLTIGPAGGVLYYQGGFRDIVAGMGSLTTVLASMSTLGGAEHVLTWNGLNVEAEVQAAHLPYWLGGVFDHPAADSAYLYWSDPTRIWRMPLIGGAASALVSGRAGIQIIAVPTTGAAAGSIFWTEGTGSSFTLKRRQVGGQIITVLTGIISPHRCFAVDNDKVYSEQNGGLVQVSINGGTVTVLSDVTQVFGPVGLALDSNYVYCGNLLGQILRVAHPPSTATNIPRGDFNGDSFPDYLLFNSATRATAIWNLHGNAFLAGVFGPTPPAGWVVGCVADLNHDGKPDYVLFNSSTHQTAIWYLNNNILTGSAFGPTLPVGWTLIAAGDLNHDGRPDYVLFNPATHQTAVWYLNGTALTGTILGPTLPAGWALVDAADFNGDSKPDYLITNATTHQTAIWYLDGTIRTGSTYGPVLPSGWTLQGAADFNNDGRADYVLFNGTTRRTAIWYLNGGVLASSAFGPTLAAGFSLVFP